MRFVSYGALGAEQPGVAQDGEVIPLARVFERLGLAAAGICGLLGLADVIAPALERELRLERERVPLDGARLGVPVPASTSVVGAGRTYPVPGAVGPGDRPPQPILFLKPVDSLVGPHDAIVRPAGSQMLDYEAELAIVIGRGGRRIPADRALDHVAGYTLANDVTAQDLMFPGATDAPHALSALALQPVLGKGHARTTPVGPWIVTSDELESVDRLELWLKVNGDVRQRASIGDMAVGIDELVAAASAVVPLRPGDLILTGTPPGIGLTMHPQQFLQPGDVVEVGIDQIGMLRNVVCEEDTRDDV
jgi:2-keto-4-pentenoate hydratase/2-oxohepta-3-ene-1,7-dioic acid hydratase in catechol pathway